MTDFVLELEAQVLSLPAADRNRLLERLLASLDEEDAIQRSWVDEALRREAEIQAGLAEPLDAAQVFAEARTELAQPR